MTAKQSIAIIAIAIVAILIYSSDLHAETQPPAEGDLLPQINLMTPESEEHQQYLDVGSKDTFSIPEIKAEVVLIEIFSMY